jgi:ligand-binding sensor domain-containing protein
MFRAWTPSVSTRARRINALAEDNDSSFLCATYDDLYRFRRGANQMEFKKIELGPPSRVADAYLVNNIAASRRGGWWLAALHGLFRLFDDGRVVHYTRANGLPDEFVETVMEDRSGRVWAGSRSPGALPNP